MNTSPKECIIKSDEEASLIDAKWKEMSRKLEELNVLISGLAVTKNALTDEGSKLYQDICEAKKSLDSYHRQKALEKLSDVRIEDWKVNEWKLTPRSRNHLIANGILTVGDLVAMKEHEVARFKNLGERSLGEIRGLLSLSGLEFTPPKFTS